MSPKIILISVMLVWFECVVSAQQTEQSDSLTRELQEVIVTSKYPVTKLIGSTLVSTIAGSTLQDIGTALDVLDQLPMIKIVDDAVTVVGKGMPEIFIDGRPMHSDDELLTLQSTNIRKVELIMAPGAIYASDTKAVLKIYTKHNFIDGLSIVDRGETIIRHKFSVNEMLDLNYKIGNWDIFISGLISHNNSLIKGFTTNTFLYKNNKTVIGSSQHKLYPSTNGVVKTGVNYSSGQQSIGGYYHYNPEQGYFNNTGTEWINEEVPFRHNIFSRIKAHSHLVSVYYDNTFADKYLLHFDGDYRTSYSTNNVQTLYPDKETDNVRSSNERKSSLWAGKLYFSLPIEKGTLTIGTQNSYTHTTLDYLMLNQNVSQYIPSSFSDIRQTLSAVFASWNNSFGKFYFSGGLRYEYVDYLFKVDCKKDEDVSRKDNFLTPDISLGYSFNEVSQISLSYKTATVKPSYSQLTGSLNYVGTHEIEGGNPSLKDERMHDVQLFGMWKGFMLQTVFTHSIDTYAFIKRIYPASNLQLLMQPININISAVNFYVIWNQQVKAWMPNFTVGVYKQWLKIDGMNYNQPIFTYYFNNIFSLPKGFLLTLNASGQTKGDMHTNRFGTTWFTLDASISKSFLNKSLQVKISGTDIFNTRNNDWTMNTYGIFVNKQQTYDQRGISLTLMYRFQPYQSKYKGGTASESETKRL
ncbi:MAG: TonB-dependent receptor [Bacteroides sp.]|nr:TonB-dependent receptor [Bacteroides sp.]